MKICRRWRRRRQRQMLEGMFRSGWMVAATVPPFLDRAPRSDMHPAKQRAYMRGFKAFQRTTQPRI
jgi:hypothetical protein